MGWKTRIAHGVAAGLVLTCALAGGANAASTYVGTPDDFMQISQLFSQYNYTIDNGDGEGWAQTFAPDGVFRDPSWCAIGKAALIKVVGTEKQIGKDQDHHHVPNLGPITYQDRNHATVHSTVMVVHETGFGKSGGIMVTGTYDDRLVRIRGQWRFAYRLVHRPSKEPPIPCAREF